MKKILPVLISFFSLSLVLFGSAPFAQTLTWDLAETGEDTTVTLEYSVGGYLSDGLQNMAEPVDGMLNSQLQRLKSYIGHGGPAPE